MRWDTVWHLAKKEILSTFRDRRALISNIVIPLVLMPVMMLGLPQLLGGLFEREAVNVTPVAVEGLDNLPDSLQGLLELSLIELQETADAEAAVRDGDFDVGLAVPDGFEDALADNGAPSLTVYSLMGNMQSELASGKVNTALGLYREQLVRSNLSDAGIDPAVLEPLTVVTLDASTEQQRASGMFGWLIPFFIAMWALMGGQMTAIDATAGEKERGTMESLLVSPVSRFEVVMGKWLATVLFGLMAAFAAIFGYLVGGALMRNLASGEEASAFTEVMGGSLTVNFQVISELVVSAVLLTAFIAALLIAITMFARSFKEAQSYLGPLSFVLVIPAVALQFRDFFDLGVTQYLIPIVNALIVMYDTVRGDSDMMGLLLTWGSLIVYTVILLLFAHRNYQREDVIFRT